MDSFFAGTEPKYQTLHPRWQATTYLGTRVGPAAPQIGITWRGPKPLLLATSDIRDVDRSAGDEPDKGGVLSRKSADLWGKAPKCCMAGAYCIFPLIPDHWAQRAFT